MSTWRKSSRSGANNNCVEARSEGNGFQVRDSKLNEESPVFDMTPADFTSLLASAKRR
ncbi:DUF397 domain-containing protein [Glycomyces sp. MUSA5-2]|uniref:DUF397 domain-containing protein n=1 Tax=Glycomyces sp. MUSA5-2 TaxID=2053002 RepID=UPI00300B4813